MTAAFADEVTVLRKEQFAGAGDVSEMNVSRMAEMMVGSEVTAKPKQRNVQSKKVPKLILQDIRVKDDIGVEVVRGLHLTIHEGEIVGVAGVSGNGQRELVEVLAGQRRASAGTVHVQDQLFQPTREKIMKHKIFCLPEEPLQNTCVGRMSVADNLAFRTFDVEPHTVGGWFINRPALRRTAQTHRAIQYQTALSGHSDPGSVGRQCPAGGLGP